MLYISIIYFPPLLTLFLAEGARAAEGVRAGGGAREGEQVGEIAKSLIYIKK